jgi:hypothetical protein
VLPKRGLRLAATWPDTQPDYMALVESSTRWSRAASAVQVFWIYAQFATAASDNDLRRTCSQLMLMLLV